MSLDFLYKKLKKCNIASGMLNFYRKIKRINEIEEMERDVIYFLESYKFGRYRRGISYEKVREKNLKELIEIAIRNNIPEYHIPRDISKIKEDGFYSAMLIFSKEDKIPRQLNYIRSRIDDIHISIKVLGNECLDLTGLKFPLSIYRCNKVKTIYGELNSRDLYISSSNVENVNVFAHRIISHLELDRNPKLRSLDVDISCSYTAIQNCTKLETITNLRTEYLIFRNMDNHNGEIKFNNVRASTVKIESKENMISFQNISQIKGIKKFYTPKAELIDLIKFPKEVETLYISDCGGKLPKSLLKFSNLKYLRLMDEKINYENIDKELSSLKKLNVIQTPKKYIYLNRSYNTN